MDCEFILPKMSRPVLSFNPTVGRNVCKSCKADNLSRVSNYCTTCGNNFKKGTFKKCSNCGWGYGEPFVRCPHCTPKGDYTKAV